MAASLSSRQGEGELIRRNYLPRKKKKKKKKNNTFSSSSSVIFDFIFQRQRANGLGTKRIEIRNNIRTKQKTIRE